MAKAKKKKRKSKKHSHSEIRLEMLAGNDQCLYFHVNPITKVIVYVGIGILTRPYDYVRTTEEHTRFLIEHGHRCVYVADGEPMSKTYALELETEIIGLINPLFNKDKRTEEMHGTITLEELRVLVAKEKLGEFKQVEQDGTHSKPKAKPKAPPKKSTISIDYDNFADKIIEALRPGEMKTVARLAHDIEFKTQGTVTKPANAGSFLREVIERLAKEGKISFMQVNGTYFAGSITTSVSWGK